MASEHEQAARWQDELLPNVVDRLARERPDAEYAEWVTATSVVRITYRQLANIINGLSWWLVEQLGPGPHGPNRDVLAYVGPNDVRYGALVLAAIKAGYVLFVTSPRNSPAAHRALFDHVQCRTFITSDPVPPPAHAILDAVKPLRHLTVPSVEELLSKEIKPYVLSKTYQELRDDPFVVMHTSGSTGLPKPIIWTQETCNRVLKSKSREAPDGTASVEGTLVNGKRVIVTLPPFHGALLAQLMCGAIPFGNVVIAPVAAAIPTAQAVVDALKKSPADVALLVPSVVAELGQLLPSELLPSSSSARDLWRYVKIHPTVGAIFDQVTDDGIFELVVRRDEALADTQPVFTVAGLEQAEEYRTKDLFERHPTIDDLWCWRARADDIIVFLNGEKTNPISMEQHIVHQNPELNGALVIGAQRFQAALLIEPVSDSPLSTAEQAALIERVWPSVEEANRSAPAHARVEKSFILVVPADRRLIRAPKGTFLRGPSISQYTEEIEKLYGNADVVADDEDDGTDDTALHTTGLDGIANVVRQQVRAVTGWSSLHETDNLFDQGMDSLQGLQLTRALRRSFRRPDLALSTIYNNPTVSQLAEAILKGRDSEVDERKVMETLLATYRGLVQQIPVPKAPDRVHREASEPVNVLLTGSTGAVGTYLLRALLDRDGIGRIFCLSRREDGGRAAQHKSFTAAGLATTELDNDDRVIFIKADFQQPLLGLARPTYELLQSKIGLVIHAAWPVNFNLTLTAFRPQLAGLVNLLSLAALSTARFTFISSVAAVEGHRSGPPPEEVLTDLDTAGPIGYGRAKLLGELLVDAAARRLLGGTAPPTAAIIRVGQAAGPVRRPGLWNPDEWLPSLVLSSLHLGRVPDSLGPLFDGVDFVPVDLLADVLVDLATATTGQGRVAGAAGGGGGDGGAVVFNLRNPRLTPWRELLPAVTDTAAGAGRKLEVVPPATWLASLRASSEEEEEEGDGAAVGINKNPALKLLDFFEALWTPTGAPAQPMVVDRALAASPSLRGLGPVSLEWMVKWVGEWIDGRGDL
ncbi:hypothetical protein VPNG_00182 [Cytospora leucostoma]|uniref:Carrier domain-containing protein n=1 Tax=Cytospora leucostoma TaxID=1230097 RepID=A0A423XND2_9PEZI|nr:hypothetical protein VPNG_00182 [Cytospora leucostoma]